MQRFEAFGVYAVVQPPTAEEVAAQIRAHEQDHGGWILSLVVAAQQDDEAQPEQLHVLVDTSRPPLEGSELGRIASGALIHLLVEGEPAQGYTVDPERVTVNAAPADLSQSAMLVRPTSETRPPSDDHEPVTPSGQ